MAKTPHQRDVLSSCTLVVLRLSLHFGIIKSGDKISYGLGPFTGGTFFLYRMLKLFDATCQIVMSEPDRRCSLRLVSMCLAEQLRTTCFFSGLFG